VASNPPPDTILRALNGQDRPLSQYLGMFHLVVVVVDPFTHESAWLLDTAARILDTFGQADCRVGFLVAGNAEEARAFLGPHTQRFLTFVDPDREFIKAVDLTELPALVHIALDASVIDCAEGWRPADWRRVTEGLARMVEWKAPNIPGPRDPAPFRGSPALG
jgi:hypothetical protein